MPVLHARRNPDNIAWPDVLHRAAPVLNEARAGGYDERLPEGMRMPRSVSARLEDDGCSTNARRSLRLKRPSTRTLPVKYSAGPFVEGCDPLRVTRTSLRRSPSAAALAGLASAGAHATRDIDMAVIASDLMCSSLVEVSLAQFFRNTSFATAIAVTEFGQPE
jgi:hypothetical protein